MTKQSKIFILLAMIAPTIASAAHSGEIYTYNYHMYVVETLQAVGGIVAGNNDVLFQMAFALSLFLFGTRILLNPKGGSLIGFESAKFLVMITMIQQLFLTAPDDYNHTFAVVDKITMEVEEVHQVPKGLGEILSLFTNLEDAIMQKMELYFSMPHSLSYRQAGLGFSMKTQMTTLNKTISDPYLDDSFTQYIKDCKVDGEWADGTQIVSEILNEPGISILDKLSTDNESLLTIIYTKASPKGDVEDCKAAWNKIKNSMKQNADAALLAEAKAKQMTLSLYKDKVLLAQEGIFSKAGESAQDQFITAMARNATLDSLQKVTSALGVNNQQFVKNKSITELNMANSAIMSNYMAAGNMPLLKAVIFSFVISLTWLLAILTIATMNMSYLKFIITMNVWLLLWSPLFQVLNYTMDVMIADTLSLYGGEISASNHTGIYMALSNQLATLANLVWSVPALAFAIAKGSDNAMVSFMAGMSAPLQQGVQAATRAEMQSLAGNVGAIYAPTGAQHSVGSGMNTQMRQGSAGTNNINTSYGNGVNGTTDVSNSHTVTTDASGKLSSISTGNLTASSSSTAQETHTEATAHKEGVLHNLGVQGVNSIQNTTQSGKSMQYTGTDGKTQTLNDTQSEAYQRINAKAISTAEKSLQANDFKVTSTEDKRALRDIGAQISADGTLFGTGLSAKMGANGSITISNGSVGAHTFNSGSEFAKAFSSTVSDSITKQLSLSKADSNTYAEAASLISGSTSAEASTTAKSVSNAFSRADEASQAVQIANSNSLAIGRGELLPAANRYYEQERFDGMKNQEKMDHFLQMTKRWQTDEDGMRQMSDFLNQYGSESASIATADTSKAMTATQLGNSEATIENLTSMGKITEQRYNEKATANNIDGLKKEYNRDSDVQIKKYNNKDPEGFGQTTNEVNKAIKIGTGIKANVDEKLSNDAVKLEREANNSRIIRMVEYGAEKIDGIANTAEDVIKNAGKSFSPDGTVKEWGDKVGNSIKPDKKADADERYYKAMENSGLLIDKSLDTQEGIDKEMLKTASTGGLQAILRHSSRHSMDGLDSDGIVDVQNELKKRGNFRYSY